MPRPARRRGLAELDALEGPVRLDELEHVRFSVSVKTRHRDGGPWRFLEAWGLNPYLRTWAAVHIERGAWQAWPTPTPVSAAAPAASASSAAPAGPTRITRRTRTSHRVSSYAGS